MIRALYYLFNYYFGNRLPSPYPCLQTKYVKIMFCAILTKPSQQNSNRFSITYPKFYYETSDYFADKEFFKARLSQIWQGKIVGLLRID